MAYRILIVDDEIALQNMVKEILIQAGYETAPALSCAQALEQFQAIQPDAVLLDVNLPDGDGFSLFGKLRERRDVPVLFLSARDEDADRLQGLGLGADDYITKPFNPLELVARVKAQLRRYKKYNPSQENVNVIDFKGLIIDNDSHRCTLYDEVLNLTPIEFSILWYLCKNRGRVITSEELFEAVWKEKYFDSNNTVMVHIRRLREKMHEPPRNPKFIKTVWGVGYQIEE